MDYRQVWIDNMGDIPDGYVIHHIDLNRENNSLTNLLMLPNGLHTKYHNTRAVVAKCNCIDLNITTHPYYYYYKTVMQEFTKVWEECIKWADYKSYLLGKSPNIHDIKIA